MTSRMELAADLETLHRTNKLDKHMSKEEFRVFIYATLGNASDEDIDYMYDNFYVKTVQTQLALLDDILDKKREKRGWNTLPIGISKVKFLSGCLGVKKYNYRGAERDHHMFNTVLYHSPDTLHKITEREWELGLSFNAAESLYKYLKQNNMSTIQGLTLIVENRDHKSYIWSTVSSTVSTEVSKRSMKYSILR